MVFAFRAFCVVVPTNLSTERRFNVGATGYRKAVVYAALPFVSVARSHSGSYHYRLNPQPVCRLWPMTPGRLPDAGVVLLLRTCSRKPQPRSS